MTAPAFQFYEKEFFIKEKDWKTPNTYDKNFSELPKSSGVYLVVAVSFIPFSKEIIYVGSSRNLHKRHLNHEVVRRVKSDYDHIQIYFQSTENEIEFEKFLIKKIQPSLNINHKK